MRAAGLVFVLAPLLMPQEPRLREGYVLVSAAKSLPAEPGRAPGGAKLGVIPVEWTDLHHPDGWNSELLNLQFSLRGQYVQRNRLNQQPSGGLVDWIQQNSFDTFKYSARAFNWIELPWAWQDVKGAAMSGPATDEILRRCVKQVTDRDGANALADITHVLVLYMGSRRELHSDNPLTPRVVNLKLGERQLRVGLVDAGPIGFRQNQELATGLAAFARMFMQLLDLPAHPVEFGPWCLMSEAWAGDNTDVRMFGEHRPFHLCGPCKVRLGWLRSVSVDPGVEQRIALRPVETWPDALRIPIAGEEHWIVENRQRRGFDRNLPGFGLLFWHVRDGIPTLVPAHGVEAPDAAWKFDLAVAFPTLHTTSFSPETTPSTRRGTKGEARVVIGGMDLDPAGVAYLTVGSKMSVGERVGYEGSTYTIVPRTPGLSAAPINVALVCVEWPDAAHVGSSAIAEEQYFRRGRFAWVRDNAGRDARRATWSFADGLRQVTGGALALEGGLVSWERDGRRESWVAMPKAQATYARTPVVQLAGEMLDEAVQKGERAAAMIDKSDAVVVVIAGRGRQGSAMVPTVTMVPRGARTLPVAFVTEETSGDPSMGLSAVLRAVKLHERATARAVSNDGSKVWCFAGQASANQRLGPNVLCAWCRIQLGWLEPYDADAGLFAIAPLVLSPSALKLPIGEGEYYLFENRTQWEFDRGVPREGLVIWHVTPKDKRCLECWETGVLDIWHVHDTPPRGGPNDLPQRYQPFLSLPKKGLSLRLPRGGWEVSGITCDPRGNLFFEILSATK